MKFALVIAFSAIALGLECRPSPPPANGYVRAAGMVFLGQRATVDQAYAGASIVFADGATTTEAVAGEMVEVDYDVTVKSNEIWSKTPELVYFEQNIKPIAKVCGLDASSTLVDFTGCLTVSEQGLTFLPSVDYASKLDLIVWQDSAEIIQGTTTAGTEHRDVVVGRRGKLTLVTPGTYYMRSLHLQEDSELILPGTGTYTLVADVSIDFDERVRITNSAGAIVNFIQKQIAASTPTIAGWIEVKQGPASRHHLIRANFCSYTPFSLGGRVIIGFRQSIQGRVEGAGDVHIDNDARVLARVPSRDQTEFPNRDPAHYPFPSGPNDGPAPWAPGLPARPIRPGSRAGHAGHNFPWVPPKKVAHANKKN